MSFCRSVGRFVGLSTFSGMLDALQKITQDSSPIDKSCLDFLMLIRDVSQGEDFGIYKGTLKSFPSR